MQAEAVPAVLQSAHEWLVRTIESMTADMPKRKFQVSYATVAEEAVFLVEVDRPAFGTVIGGASGVHADALRSLARVVARASGYRGRFDVKIRDLVT